MGKKQEKTKPKKNVPAVDFEKVFGDDINKPDSDLDSFHTDGKFENVELTDEEKIEIEEALANMRGYNVRLPKPFKWRWNMGGKFYFRVALKVLEFGFLILALYFLLPLSINITMTWINSIYGAVLLTFLRSWIR